MNKIDNREYKWEQISWSVSPFITLRRRTRSIKFQENAFAFFHLLLLTDSFYSSYEVSCVDGLEIETSKYIRMYKVLRHSLNVPYGSDFEGCRNFLFFLGTNCRNILNQIGSISVKIQLEEQKLTPDPHQVYQVSWHRFLKGQLQSTCRHPLLQLL